MNAWQSWHCVGVLLATGMIISNWTDRTKYPEGHCCLCGWFYLIIGVVCGTLSFYSLYLTNKQAETPLSASEYQFGHWAALSSLIVFGVILIGLYVYGSGKCPALLAAWHVGRRLYVVISV